MDTTTLIIVVCVIIFVVIPSLKKRTFHVKKLLLGPGIFVYLFYQSIQDNFHLFPISYFFIAAGTVLGIMTGYFLRKSTEIIVDPFEKMITLKGSFFTLYTFTFIFIVHFIVGYLTSVSPKFFHFPSFGNQSLLLVLALTSFLTVGSNTCLMIKFFREKEKITSSVRRNKNIKINAL
jgi:hypothetical protein